MEWVQGIIIDAQRGEKALMPYVSSESQDQCAQTCSLICAFAVRRHLLQYPLMFLADKEFAGWSECALSANCIIPFSCIA